jgi:hypothetical protein
MMFTYAIVCQFLRNASEDLNQKAQFLLLFVPKILPEKKNSQSL